MTFLRLTRLDWLAFVAAMALLLAMSVDWYTTTQGQECRRIEQLQSPASGGGPDLIGRDVRRTARECAEKREKNAWQAPAAIDRLIALVLLVAIASAVAAAFLRAADRRFESRVTPSVVAAYAGLVGALLVLYRILQPPGFNPSAVVKWGAPVGLALLGILAIASRSASVAEREREPAAAGEPAAVDEAPAAVEEPAPETEAIREPEEAPAAVEEPAPETEAITEPEEAPAAVEGPAPETEAITEPEEAPSAVEEPAPETEAITEPDKAPSAVEQPTVVDEPAAVEEPAPEEEPAPAQPTASKRRTGRRKPKAPTKAKPPPEPAPPEEPADPDDIGGFGAPGPTPA